MQQFNFVTPASRTLLLSETLRERVQQSPAEGNPPAALLHRKSLVDEVFPTYVYTVALLLG
ncbi:hypothetical protein [uncultured Nostoc sp.]|uniref:hypothetical protein n=1 Tax=uncultured Nostoc sp. TaxID=340711 RepID=UPI0035CB03D4